MAVTERVVCTQDGLPLRLFSVDEYEAMIRAGILGKQARCELIRGVIVNMPPIGDEHVWTVNRSTRSLVLAFGTSAWVGPGTRSGFPTPCRSPTSC